MSKPTTAIFFNKYKVNEKGNCPVSLRVTFDRKRKYYPTVFEFTPDEWKRMQGERPRKDLKNNLIQLQVLEKRAIDIIRSMPVFTWEGFDKNFLNRKFLHTLRVALEDYATDLRKNDQIGTAVFYECAAGSLDQFWQGKLLSEITPAFLQSYEKWMLAKDNSITTVSIYTRCVRSVFNKAIEDGTIARELYPFGRHRYEIPTVSNTKRALPMNDIAKIFDYETEQYSNLDRARDYWLFIYLCNGMNVKDMALLKYKQIHGDKLVFVRAKTARTKRKVEEIEVPLLEDIKRIISKWGQPKKSPETHIFPILKEGLTAERQRDLIQLITHLVNNHLKTIAQDLGLDKLTTYTARHSFATVLKRSGASTEYIGEALGHANVKTTQNYLAGFEDEEKRKWAQVLLPDRNKLKAV